MSLQQIENDDWGDPEPTDDWTSEWYPRDTLSGAMEIPERYWQAHPSQFARMCDVVARAGENGLLNGTRRTLRALYLRPSTPA